VYVGMYTRMYVCTKCKEHTGVKKTEKLKNQIIVIKQVANLRPRFALTEREKRESEREREKGESEKRGREREREKRDRERGESEREREKGEREREREKGGRHPVCG